MGCFSCFDFLQVLNPEVHGDGLGKYVSYEVHVNTSLPQFGGRPGSVRRRFRDFQWLWDSLGNEVYQPGAVQRPNMPEKNSFGNMDSDYDNWSFVESRRRELEAFIGQIICQRS